MPALSKDSPSDVHSGQRKWRNHVIALLLYNAYFYATRGGCEKPVIERRNGRAIESRQDYGLKNEGRWRCETPFYALLNEWNLEHDLIGAQIGPAPCVESTSPAKLRHPPKKVSAMGKGKKTPLNPNPDAPSNSELAARLDQFESELTDLRAQVDKMAIKAPDSGALHGDDQDHPPPNGD